jgi:hypothetical protein
MNQLGIHKQHSLDLNDVPILVQNYGLMDYY